VYANALAGCRLDLGGRLTALPRQHSWIKSRTKSPRHL